ncbi:MAG: S8 family serine peptidase, partial [Nannocystaceae bacterium]|nr:S8 family serine peptidase [Nannocystaceae bacterium]
TTGAAGAGHGTSVSAIVAATDAYGVEDRGVTSAIVDSWKTSNVDPISGACRRQPDFVAAGFENAVQNDEIINASFGFEFEAGNTAEGLQIENIANDAFVTGAVVIAATGNSGAEGNESVTAPGSAPNVIGVGAITESGDVPDYSGRGPSYIGGRVKPDLLGPTDVTTACASSASCGDVFGGTSAASPMVAGAAAQILDVFDSAGGFDTIDPQLVPGTIYSTLIGFGTPLSGGATAGSFNNTEGAGVLDLGKTSCARWRWGTISLGEGEIESREINIVTSTNNVRVAAWWSDAPNGADLGHREVELGFCKNGGCTVSAQSNSVFQQIVEPSIDPGTWEIRVQSPPSSPFGGDRIVHYFFYAEWPEWQCTI